MKSKKLLLALSLAILPYNLISIPVYAEEKSVYLDNNKEKDYNEFDKFIIVQNNKYVLNIVDETVFNQEDLETVKLMVEKANETIVNEDLIINPSNKIATPRIATRAYGKNAIEFHWNYARIYLDAGQTKALVNATIAGGSTALGGFFGQIGGAAAGAIIGAYLSTVIGDNIKNGVWVDYNYFAGRVNNFGWQ
jgi:hypothetical protein